MLLQFSRLRSTTLFRLLHYKKKKKRERHFTPLATLTDLFYVFSTFNTSFFEIEWAVLHAAAKMKECYRKINISVPLLYKLQWHNLFVLFSIIPNNSKNFSLSFIGLLVLVWYFWKISNNYFINCFPEYRNHRKHSYLEAWMAKIIFLSIIYVY